MTAPRGNTNWEIRIDVTYYFSTCAHELWLDLPIDLNIEAYNLCITSTQINSVRPDLPVAKCLINPQQYTQPPQYRIFCDCCASCRPQRLPPISA